MQRNALILFKILQTNRNIFCYRNNVLNCLSLIDVFIHFLKQELASIRLLNEKLWNKWQSHEGWNKLNEYGMSFQIYFMKVLAHQVGKLNLTPGEVSIKLNIKYDDHIKLNSNVYYDLSEHHKLDHAYF